MRLGTRSTIECRCQRGFSTARRAKGSPSARTLVAFILEESPHASSRPRGRQQAGSLELAPCACGGVPALANGYCSGGDARAHAFGGSYVTARLLRVSGHRLTELMIANSPSAERAMRVQARVWSPLIVHQELLDVSICAIAGAGLLVRISKWTNPSQRERSSSGPGVVAQVRSDWRSSLQFFTCASAVTSGTRDNLSG